MIETKTTAWGVTLLGRPFGETRPEIEITIEVEHPRPARKPNIKIHFDGVPSLSAIGRTDVAAWQNCLTAMLAHAEIVSARLQEQAAAVKPKRRRKSRKKK